MWTKKIPKSPGLYWFWHSNESKDAVIIRVLYHQTTLALYEVETADGPMIPVSDVAIYYMNYHFGPKILVPSVRDLRKRTKRRER